MDKVPLRIYRTDNFCYLSDSNCRRVNAEEEAEKIKGPTGAMDSKLTIPVILLLILVLSLLYVFFGHMAITFIGTVISKIFKLI